MTGPHGNQVEGSSIGGNNFQARDIYGNITHVHGADRPNQVLNTLVPPPSVLVGRSRELKELLSNCAEAVRAGRPVVVSAVHGMGGVGKTALVRSAAAQLAGEFTDAQLEIDLFGFTPGESPRAPGAVLADLLRLVGYGPAEIPASTEGRSQQWRAWLSARRVLLVLDNARDGDQIRPLLPGAGGTCLVLVTSRHRLDDLDVGVRTRVDALSPGGAAELLAAAAGRSGPELGTAAQLDALARLCGYLPLALGPVGALLADLSIADLTAAMRSAERPLKHIPRGDRAAEAAFAVSFGALEPQTQWVLEACALHPGPDFDRFSIAAIADVEIPVAAIQLSDLLRRNLLIGLPQDRYAFHDVFLSYAGSRAGEQHSDQARADCRERLYEGLRERLSSSVDSLTAGAGAQDDGEALRRARAWLSCAADELNAVAQASLVDNWGSGQSFADLTAFWLWLDGRYEQASDLYTRMRVAALDQQDRLGEAQALDGLGDVAYMRNEYDEAIEHYQRAHRLYSQIGNLLGQADVLRGLGDVTRMRNAYPAAAAYYRQAHGLYDQIGERTGKANVLKGMGDVACGQSGYAEAAEYYQQAQDLYNAVGNRLGQANALNRLGDVAYMRNEYDKAVADYRRSHDLYLQIGNRLGQANALKGLGDVAHMRNEYDEAVGHYRRARDLYDQIGDRSGEANVLKGLGDVAYTRNQHDEATEYSRRAHDLYKKIGDRSGQGDAIKNLGDAAYGRAEYDKAVEHYRRARDIYKLIGNRLGQANALNRLGDVAYTRNQDDEAIEHYRLAHRLYDQIGHRSGQANVHLGTARIRARLNDAEAALASYAEARRLYAEVDMRYWVEHCDDAMERLRQRP